MGKLDDFQRLTKVFEVLFERPLVLVVVLAASVSVGSERVYDFIFPPRDDPWTGTLAEADRRARVRADEDLAAAIKRLREDQNSEILRISRNLQSIKSTLEAEVKDCEGKINECEAYRNRHKVESQKGFDKIEFLEIRVEDLEDQVRDLERR